MKYNPDIHHRRSIRLKDYDYSANGAYFVTICANSRQLYFEEYPELKQIVTEQWEDIPNRYSNIKLDEFTVMPNHIHGIIFIVGATLAVAPDPTIAPTLTVEQDIINSDMAANMRAGARPAPTVGDIVGTFKSLSIRDWLRHIKEYNINAVGKFWQRNYYEHIIRNENELYRIREYIQNNPLKWELDQENPYKTNKDIRK